MERIKMPSDATSVTVTTASATLGDLIDTAAATDPDFDGVFVNAADVEPKAEVFYRTDGNAATTSDFKLAADSKLQVRGSDVLNKLTFICASGTVNMVVEIGTTAPQY